MTRPSTAWRRPAPGLGMFGGVRTYTISLISWATARACFAAETLLVT